MRKVAQGHILLWALGLILIAMTLLAARSSHAGAFTGCVYSLEHPQADTMALVRQWSGAAPEEINNQFSLVTSPRWSPDGEWIAFMAAGDRSQGRPPDYFPTVYRIRPDGRDLQLLARVEDPRAMLVEDALEWSPDGQWIFFAAQSHGVYRVAAEGGPLWAADYGNGMPDAVWVSEADGQTAEVEDGMFFSFGTDSLAAAWPERRLSLHADLGGEGGLIVYVWDQQPTNQPPNMQRVPGIDGMVTALMPVPPDADAAIFATQRPGGGADIFRLTFDDNLLIDPTLEHLVNADDYDTLHLRFMPGLENFTVEASVRDEGDIFVLPVASTGLRALTDLRAVERGPGLASQIAWSPPVERPFRWGWLLVAGIVCLAWGVGLWARALLRLRRVVGTLRLPVIHLVLADSGPALGYA